MEEGMIVVRRSELIAHLRRQYQMNGRPKHEAIDLAEMAVQSITAEPTCPMTWEQFFTDQQRDIERARACSGAGKMIPIGTRIEGAGGRMNGDWYTEQEVRDLYGSEYLPQEAPAEPKPEQPRHSADDYGAIARRLSEIGVSKWAGDPEE